MPRSMRQRATETQALAILNTILDDIDTALTADRTLGGTVDYCEPTAPTTDTDTLEGSAPMLAARLGITLIYTTPRRSAERPIPSGEDMARARGINARLAGVVEATYGVAPVNGYPPAAVHQHDARRGTGADRRRPARHRARPAGAESRRDQRHRRRGGAGRRAELRLLAEAAAGAPTTTADTDVYTHEFTSAKASLPSASLEIGHPEVPAYAMNKGALANTLAIRMQRSGTAQATIGLIAQSELPSGASGAGSPTELEVVRFNQFQGSVKRDGVAMANVVSADLTYSNNYELVEVIRSDGLIAGGDPGKASFTASVTVRFDSLDLYNLAVAGTPVDLEFGFTIDAENSLTFALPAMHLPRAKRPVTGPAGVRGDLRPAGGAAGAGRGDADRHLSSTISPAIEAAMYRLDLKRLPYWVPLGLGVKVEVLPFGTEVELRSRDLPEELRAEMNRRHGGEVPRRDQGLRPRRHHRLVRPRCGRARGERGRGRRESTPC